MTLKTGQSTGSSTKGTKRPGMRAWGVPGFVACVLILGIVPSVLILRVDNGLSLLLVFGATCMAIGTLTQMAISLADPAGIREAALQKETQAAVAVLKQEEFKSRDIVEKIAIVSNGGTIADGKRLVRNYRKVAKKSSGDLVDKVLAAEISDLRRRKRTLNYASLGWSSLAVGSLMLVVNAVADLLSLAK